MVAWEEGGESALRAWLAGRRRPRAGDGRGRLLDRRLRAAAPHIRAVDELISNASPSLQLRLSWCGPVSRGHTIRVWQ